MPTKFLFAALLCAALAACNAGAPSPSSSAGSAAESTAGAQTASPTRQRMESGQQVTASAPVSLSAAPHDNLPPITIHLAGDSTVSNYASTTTQEGWGMELGQFFDDKVTIDNKAIGGAKITLAQGIAQVAKGLYS